MVKRNSFDGGGRSNKRRKSNDGRGIDRNTNSNNDGCSVFVGNLKYETKWQALKDHMRRAGNVDSASILEAPNGRSKGCALVTYQHPKEAQRAIKELNESELEGRTVFVQPDNGKPNNGSRQNEGNRVNNYNSPNNQYGVFVGNLPYECSWQALKDFFKSCGYIERAEVMEDAETGRKKGYGIVTFSNERSMENAIRKFNGSDFQGRTLEVRPEKKSSARTSSGGGGEFKVYFGNLDFDCSWQDLKDLVQKRCGRVEHVDIPKRGWGVVTFATRRDGATAISLLDKVVFENRALEVRWDRDSGSSNPSSKTSNAKQLYVGNLSYDCTWQNLKDAFKRYGSVSHAEVCETANGRTTGFGIVAYTKSSDAERALSLMDGADFQGRKLSVRWDRNPEKLESEKVGGNKRDSSSNYSSKKRGQKPKPATKIAMTDKDSMQDDEPQGDPLDMALSAPR